MEEPVADGSPSAFVCDRDLVLVEDFYESEKENGEDGLRGKNVFRNI